MLGHRVCNSPVCCRFKEKEKGGGTEDDVKRESIKKGIPEGGSSGNGATFRQQDVRQPADIPVLSDANSLVFRAARQLCDNSMSRRLLLRAATAAWPPSSSTKAIYVTFSFVVSLFLSLKETFLFPFLFLFLWMIAPFSRQVSPSGLFPSSILQSVRLWTLGVLILYLLFCYMWYSIVFYRIFYFISFYFTLFYSFRLFCSWRDFRGMLRVLT